jgi:hypothetical protein
VRSLDHGPRKSWRADAWIRTAKRRLDMQATAGAARERSATAAAQSLAAAAQTAESAESAAVAWEAADAADAARAQAEERARAAE